ncbi:hypothetical protein [Endozoicomonas sp. 2B-B]
MMIQARIQPGNNNRLLDQWRAKIGQETGDTTQPTFSGRFIARYDNFLDKNLMLKVCKDAKEARSFDAFVDNRLEDLAHEKEMKYYPNFLDSSPHKDRYNVPVLGAFCSGEMLAPVIAFDRSCKLADEDQVRAYLEKKNVTESVADLTCSSLEKMAQLGNWSDQRVPFHASILKYTLNSDFPEISHLGWHYDWTSLSMLTVVSPCEQENGTYSGGELSFAERAQETFFSRLYSKFFYTPSYIPETVKTYSYPESGCFFFENLWSEHKVNKMSLVAGESCERVLFTLFANPNLEQLMSFLSRNSDKNLVTKDGL